jgi:phosphocarrier protein HPr
MAAERSVVVGSRVGLHARPAALFVQAASKLPVKVMVSKEDTSPVDARSILSVLGLDVRGGQEIILTAEGGPRRGRLRQPGHQRPRPVHVRGRPPGRRARGPAEPLAACPPQAGGDYR